jgi:transcriptional regulator of arginine metabolism
VGWDNVLGTIAGDDTVMMITRDPAGGAAVADTLLGLHTS